jgi:N6-adenosine-specific RNA methylase IME4
MTTKLIKYDAAHRALAAAVRVDEVKTIRDKAVAMEVYAKQARDSRLLADATAIRERATRRLGELIEIDRKAGKLAKGGGDKRSKHRVTKRPADSKSLADQGIDKHLADRARKAAAMPEDKFEARIERNVRIAVAATEGDASIVKEARKKQQEEKRTRRAERERALADRITALPDRRYGVILADPEWRFEPWSRETGMDRAADNHYPTSALDVIMSRPVEAIAADDCVLFLWATQAMERHAHAVMEAWGFDSKSHIIWRKVRSGDGRGTGYWFINEHELLLVGTRGKVPAPAPGTQWKSVIDAPIGEHSVKPECFLAMIEHYFPNVPKIELNRRGRARPGWEAWGLEATE